MSIDVEQFRRGDERRWEIPLFATDLTAGVMPLFVNKDDFLHHIGTAFLISGAGVIATAAHCIAAAMRLHGLDPDRFPPGEEHDLLNTQVKLSVLHIHKDGERVQCSIWSVANAQIAHPTDVAFGCLHDIDAPTARLAAIADGETPVPCKAAIVTAHSHAAVGDMTRWRFRAEYGGTTRPERRAELKSRRFWMLRTVNPLVIDIRQQRTLRQTQ